MDALSEALFGPEPVAGDVLIQAALSLGAGLSFPCLDMSETRGLASGRAAPLGIAEESLSYGDPFERGRSEPFSRFEQRLRLGRSEPPQRFHLQLADRPLGQLRGLEPGNRATLRPRFLDRERDPPERRSHGHQRNRIPARGIGKKELRLRFRRGAKAFFVAAQPRLGSLRLEYVAYGLHSIPAAQDADSGFGYAVVGMPDLSYERCAMDHLGLSLAYRLYHKDAFYESFSDVHESIQSVTLYMKIL